MGLDFVDSAVTLLISSAVSMIRVSCRCGWWTFSATRANAAAARVPSARRFSVVPPQGSSERIVRLAVAYLSDHVVLTPYEAVDIPMRAATPGFPRTV
ncbi:hypothetical protein [Streptomyces sp. AC555_RSS877]|uniref:hypothetical protein n=1 Tax=Streptomyces sp. AC555_RSS877 TaxID=2823688 RepID=UPI001C277314|nr:hypothetical protein [Streptomyces sp. AC555_RSS877]